MTLGSLSGGVSAKCGKFFPFFSCKFVDWFMTLEQSLGWAACSLFCWQGLPGLPNLVHCPSSWKALKCTNNKYVRLTRGLNSCHFILAAFCSNRPCVMQMWFDWCVFREMFLHERLPDSCATGRYCQKHPRSHAGSACRFLLCPSFHWIPKSTPRNTEANFHRQTTSLKTSKSLWCIPFLCSLI